ncbi:RT0821/Lpp0805 family surface protein [Motiliproteus sediminis]|uniref:RT0821/Lpp0805 family surface protein n=1 Tax=Motiliproteus sediminis TaxID=1468178 RepID=UPI001AF02104|nr:RT0821/Lpp0805 family surface protein [Motiliproteus sediminis]
MKGYDDGLVMAYVDGELDGRESAEFEKLLQQDTGLQQQVRRLREMNAALGVAFNEAMHGEMPPLRAFAGRRQPPWWERLSDWLVDAGSARWQPMATAALVLVVASGGGGYLLSQGGESAAVVSPAVVVDATLNHTLETQMSGTTVEWQDEQTGLAGTITPVRTFKTEQGKFCREFLERQLIKEQWQEQRGIACREGKEEWQVRARYYL